MPKIVSGTDRWFRETFPECPQNKFRPPGVKANWWRPGRPEGAWRFPVARRWEAALECRFLDRGDGPTMVRLAGRSPDPGQCRSPGERVRQFPDLVECRSLVLTARQFRGAGDCRWRGRYRRPAQDGRSTGKRVLRCLRNSGWRRPRRYRNGSSTIQTRPEDDGWRAMT